MPVVSNGNRLLQFGIFEVDLKAGELRRNGSKVRLQEQPFQVLTVLLEQPGEVVSREELRNRLWPADTFVDFDHSLNAAIRRLREALGDSADSPRFVETVARRGYRFLVPVNGKPVSDVLTPNTSQNRQRGGFARALPLERSLCSWRSHLGGGLGTHVRLYRAPLPRFAG